MADLEVFRFVGKVDQSHGDLKELVDFENLIGRSATAVFDEFAEQGRESCDATDCQLAGICDLTFTMSESPIDSDPQNPPVVPLAVGRVSCGRSSCLGPGQVELVGAKLSTLLERTPEVIGKVEIATEPIFASAKRGVENIHHTAEAKIRPIANFIPPNKEEILAKAEEDARGVIEANAARAARIKGAIVDSIVEEIKSMPRQAL